MAQDGGGLFANRLDSAATSLRGYGGYLRLGKDNGDWLWETATNIRSPGFEVNDLSFMGRADYVWNNANIVRQWTVPGSWYRNMFADRRRTDPAQLQRRSHRSAGTDAR